MIVFQQHGLHVYGQRVESVAIKLSMESNKQETNGDMLVFIFFRNY